MLKDTIKKTIDESPDPYSDAMSIVMHALRAGTASGRMSQCEWDLLSDLYKLAIERDPANKHIA